MTGTLSAQTEDLWLRRFHPEPAATVRLVCFPHAGGSATTYYPLSAALAGTAEVIAVQYPGRQDRRSEPCVENLSALADHIVAVLAGQDDDRPVAFFGHSMGSVLAFEVARRREAAGGRLEHLFASGYPAPSRLRGGSVHARDDTGVVAELRLVGGTSPEWLDDHELLAMVLPAVRADYRAIETHPRAAARLRSPITMLVGDADPHTSLDEARSWAEHTDRDFGLHVFTGGHFYLDEHGADVAAVVSSALRGGRRA